MIRKTLWITMKLGFCALVAVMLFVWQGGWWYVRPTFQWHRDIGDIAHAWNGFYCLSDSNHLVLFNGCDRSCNPPGIHRGFEVVESESGNTLFFGHLTEDETDPSRTHYFFDGKDIICFLELNQKQLTVFDLRHLTSRGPMLLPKNFPDSLWLGSFCENSATLYCGQQNGSFWKIDLASGDAQLTFTNKIGRGIIRADTKFAYATDPLHKSILALDLANGRTVWTHNVEPARVIDIRSDGIGQCVWYRLLDGVSDENRLLIKTTDRLVSSATGTELYSATWKDPEYDEHDEEPAGNEELSRVVRHRSWSRPRFIRSASVLPLSLEDRRPASFVMVDPLRVRPNRVVQLSQAYQDCSPWTLELVNDNLFILQEDAGQEMEVLKMLRRSKWVPEFALHYCSALIRSPTQRPSGCPVAFDPYAPEESRFALVDRDGSDSVIPSQDGRAFATMKYDGANAQILVRVYSLPLRTCWGMRLAVAILVPLVILLVIPRGWRRMRERRISKSNDPTKST